MSPSLSVKDKRVAVTGTFVDISRGDAEKALARLGAVLGDLRSFTQYDLDLLGSGAVKS